MKQVDLNGSESRYLKALVYGKPGTGKTTFGVSAPRPLIVLGEAHAVPHIKAAMARLGRRDVLVVAVTCAEDYRSILRALHGDKSKPFVIESESGDEILRSEWWPESIVIDSVTEACNMLIAEIRRQSPPKMGKDGLPVDSERFWFALGDRAAGLIRAFRDVPFHVLFLALLDDRMQGEGDEASRWVGPMLPMRKLPNVLQSVVNVVGITARRNVQEGDERALTYTIRTNGPDYVDLKPFPPLREHESTDFTDWIERVNGEAEHVADEIEEMNESGAESAGKDEN